MPGGAAAIRQPWRMAAAYLDAAYAGGPRPGWRVAAAERAAVGGRHRDGRARGVNAPLTSSAGRLFDAVAALLGVRDTINYEGQAAIELEQLADPAEGRRRPTGPRIDAGEPLRGARRRPGRGGGGRPARRAPSREVSRPGSTAGSRR